MQVFWVKDHEKLHVKINLFALERVRAIASPADNECLKTGSSGFLCIKAEKYMDCKSDKKICGFYMRTGFQMIKDRITGLML